MKCMLLSMAFKACSDLPCAHLLYILRFVWFLTTPFSYVKSQLQMHLLPVLVFSFSKDSFPSHSVPSPFSILSTFPHLLLQLISCPSLDRIAHYLLVTLTCIFPSFNFSVPLCLFLWLLLFTVEGMTTLASCL